MLKKKGSKRKDGLIDDRDLILEENDFKVRLILALDRRLTSLTVQEERLHKKIRTNFDADLEMAILKVNKALAEIHITKACVLLSPALDVELKGILKDKYEIDLNEP